VKLVVLGFDGLEPSLIEEFKLHSLYQVDYGYMGLSGYTEPLTPKVWATYITGAPPNIHGINNWYVYDGISKVIRRVPLLRRYIHKRLVDRRDLRVDTVFEKVPSLPLYVPAYNEPEWIHREYDRAISQSTEKFIKLAFEIHHLRVSTFFEALDIFTTSKIYTLMFAWFDITDLMGHYCIHKCRRKLKIAYISASSILRRVRNLVSNDTAVLVLTDHGIEPSNDGVSNDGVTGEHRYRAFYSLNKDIDSLGIEKPRKPEDVYKLMIDILKV